MSGGYGPPPEIVLRLRPRLRVFTTLVLPVVVAEFLAGYLSEALFDILTLIVGIFTLRDASRMGQCMGLLAFVSSLSTLADTITLVTILAGMQYIPGGARNFFATVCYANVTVVDQQTGAKTTETQEVCGWQTILGNCAIVLAIIVQFMCASTSWRCLRAYQAGDVMALSSMPSFLPAPATTMLSSRRPVPQEHEGIAAHPLVQDPTGAGGGRGYTPYGGQAHRLVD